MRGSRVHWVAQGRLRLLSFKSQSNECQELLRKYRLKLDYVVAVLRSGSTALRQFKSIYGNQWFSADFRGNRSYSTRLNSINIRSKIWRRSLKKTLQ